MARRNLYAWLLRRWYSHKPIGVFIPLSALFVLLTTLRRRCYRYGILRVVKLQVPVIVVGNITVGGTGKTPFVIWLTRALQKQGYRPGIITRGYGGRSQHWPLRVTTQSDAIMVGDEAVILAQRTQAPVVAGPDRVQAARLLLQEYNPDVIVSDDGLQHYRLERDLSIVMLDGQRLLGNGWRLPAGPLREPASRLSEVDLVICKGDPSANHDLPAGIFNMHFSLGDAVNLVDGSHRALVRFAGQPVHALAGIGNPQQFFDALEKYGLQVDGRSLPDHAELSETELRFGEGAPVLMTEKDAIKCRGMNLPDHWYVPAHAEFSEQDVARILNVVQQKLMSMGVIPMHKS